MIKKIKENKKADILYKINTFLAFCSVEDYKKEITQVAIDKLNKIVDNILNINILIDKKKNYCTMTIYFIDKSTLETIFTFKMPNL